MYKVALILTLVFLAKSAHIAHFFPSFYFACPPSENNRILISKEVWTIGWNDFDFDKRLNIRRDVWFNFNYSGWSAHKFYNSHIGVERELASGLLCWAQLGLSIESFPEILNCLYISLAHGKYIRH